MEAAQSSSTGQHWILRIALAVAMKAQFPQYRGIEPRGIGKRAWARSLGFSNAKHMARVMAERAKALQEAGAPQV